jgi:hypothetical protein
MHRGARQLPVQHLSIRLPWHDTGWAGTVCREPAKNSWCMVLKGIRDRRDEGKEAEQAGSSWLGVDGGDRPACVVERGAALNPAPYAIRSRHPFAESSKETHGHFAENTLHVPAFSVLAVPYRWTRKDDAEAIATRIALPFDPDREPDLGFATPWLNDFDNQGVMLDTFFGAVQADASLVFLYVKRTPLADDPRRVLAGVGIVRSVGPLQEHAYVAPPGDKLRGLIWDRAVTHSIRPGSREGFVLPYQELLAVADEQGLDPSQFLAFAPDEAFEEFSNVAEHVSHDHAIASLLALADRVRVVREHVAGPWDAHLDWISTQLARLWQLRGPFPGLGQALHAFELGYGTMLAMDLASRFAPNGKWTEDPWLLVAKALATPKNVLSSGIADHVKAFDAKRLCALTDERRRLLELLSRFQLTVDQAKRFFDPDQRPGLTDSEILSNPYRLFELDRHRADGVSVGTIDRGMFPDASVRASFPLPAESRLEGDQDPRRVRALVVHVLATAESEGHTLLPVRAVLARVAALELDPPCRPTTDLLSLLEPELAPIVVNSALANEEKAWQFADRRTVGELIRAEVTRRRGGKRHSANYDWRKVVDDVIGVQLPDDNTERVTEERARQEKALALGELFAARISLLLGQAGTGKTTLLNALCQLPEVSANGILLLAPTGKARVALQGSTKLKALTIAQFLSPHRYDADTQRYHLSEASKVDAGETVIIDECSMVTEDQLAAVFQAIKGPKRIILVGDHRQLPPIGAGRPLVDIVSELAPPDVDSRFPRVAPCYTELTIHRRQIGGVRGDGTAGTRDDLLLASWFAGGAPDPGADEIWARLGSGKTDGHVVVRTWQTEEELQAQLLAGMVEHIEQIEHDADERGFAGSLGGVVTDKGVYFNNEYTDREGRLRHGSARSCERWQVLTPVRGRGHGVDELNRFLHERFRRAALEFATKKWSWTPHPVGAQRIIYGDKVMSTVNQRRGTRSRDREQVSNGEIGLVVGESTFGRNGSTPKRMDVEFRSQLGTTFCYWPNDFGDEASVVLELAFALTIHKSQGSQFGTVFVVIPQPCFILGRELLYTALTRQQDRVVLLVQGQPADLRAYSSSRWSEVARRYTNLFRPPSMFADEKAGFLEHRLIHRTARGELVRSISEVVVADALHAQGIEYRYEEALRGPGGVERYPDFTAEDPASGVKIYWEHLGMLSNPEYARRWKEKLEWYAAMGLAPDGPENEKGERLVISENRMDGAIDSAQIRGKVREVFDL